MEYIAKILIVDDNERNRNLLNQMILSLGHVPIHATNGLSALSQLREKQIDLVLLDILMPEMNGYEVLEHIGKDYSLSEIPVIMISAVDEIDSVVRCIRNGAIDYLVKPFNSTLLETRIESCLDKKRLRDSEKRLDDYERKMFLELKKLHEELETNYKSLQEAELARDTMSHILVHDIRNRLNVIKGFAQLIKMVNDDSQLSFNILKIVTAVEDLSFLTKSILDVSKIESGEMQSSLDSVNIPALINDVYEEFIPYANEKKVQLSFNPNSQEIVAMADKGLLSRILQNLINNGIQHTESDLAISIDNDDNWVTISIEDNGIGIPPEYREKIFDKYFQIEAGADRKKYGVGLGLAFCKMAVDAQNGSIWVESDEGRGANFKVRLHTFKKVEKNNNN